MKIAILLLTVALAGLFQTSRKRILFYIGVTDKSAEAAVRLAELDPDSGEITILETVKTGPAPGYLCLSPDKKALYTVTGDQQVNAYRVEETGRLGALNSAPSEGLNPCHVAVHPGGRLVLVANYTGGSFTAYRLGADGKIESLTYKEQYEGTGPNARRQEKAHAHSAASTPDGRFVFVADLGTDRLMNYTVDKSSLQLTPNAKQPYFSGVPGSGPRHFVVHPSGKWLYILNELDATVTAASISSEGVITATGTYKTLPDDYKEPGNTSAAIRLHPGGRFLYVSNRGYDAIHGFRIAGDGKLSPVTVAREAISTPRDFNITPDGSRLVVANLKTNDFAVYKLDAKTGRLAFQKKTGKVTEPSCIEFL